jgi:signal transduction histidine kinase
MIDGLLSFARNEQESARLELSDFAVNDLVAEVREEVARELETRRLQFAADIDPGLVTHADRDRILRVLLNLVSNAIKFNREGGSIRVRAQSGSGDRILVEVADTGIGIAAPDLDRIFDRGFQVTGEGAPGRGGAGLGLAIVRDILRLHGCRIYSPQSTVGVGTTFRFELPRAASGARSGETGSDPLPGPDATPEDEPALDPDPESDDGNGEDSSGGRGRPRFKILRPE